MIVTNQVGLAIDDKEFKLVKKVGIKGEKIPKHNHPEAKILFSPVKGIIKTKVDEEEVVLKPGEMLNFDGNSYISAEFLEDGEVFITLILKDK